MFCRVESPYHRIMLRTKVQLNVSLIDGILYIEEWASKPK